MSAVESEPSTLQVVVIGSGTMGAALAHLAASAGHVCILLTADTSVVETINAEQRHPRFFGGPNLHAGVRAATNTADYVSEADLLVMAVPSCGMRKAAREVGGLTHAGQSVLSATKGFEPSTHQRMSQVLLEECPGICIGMLGGPNITLDLVRNLPTALMVAAESPQVRVYAQQALASPLVRIHTSADLLSYEYVAVLKNIVALETGVVTGLGLGDNFRALVMAEGMAEISKLMTAMELDASVLYGLAGLSDIFLTCSSGFAHNYAVGVKMGRGEATLADIQAMLKDRGETAEGLESLKAGLALAQQHGCELPLLKATCEFVYGGGKTATEDFLSAVFR
jgi:glycerol-3-phosphate dehydrogenase (NAD(P)+)